jgi:regulator of RNase E activity RraA
MNLISGKQMAGRAFTVKYGPARDGGTVGDYLDDVPAGAVVVLDNAGRTDVTLWGDILTTAAIRKGLEGVAIDGACRDVARYADGTLPVFARGVFMRTGKERVQAEGVQVPIKLGGVSILPGDIVVGDQSGVIVVPQAHEREVLAAARDIEEAERRIIELLAQGSSLKAARERHGYHSLQSSSIARSSR